MHDGLIIVMKINTNCNKLRNVSEKHSDTLAQGDNLVQSEILAQSDTLAENLFCIFLCLITKVTARF